MGNGIVLDARDDDEGAGLLARACAPGCRHDTQRVGFGGAGGKDDLVNVGPQGLSDLFARVVERALAQRRGGRVVEVDTHAWERASSMIARAAGTTSLTSPTTPKSAISKIGASGSSHTARMWAADCMPTVW